MGRGVDRDGVDGVALLFISAFVLIVLAAVTLAAGLLSDGLRLPVVALVAGVGGLLLLWLGVIRRSSSRSSAG